jgi:hypothetical protein
MGAGRRAGPADPAVGLLRDGRNRADGRQPATACATCTNAAAAAPITTLWLLDHTDKLLSLVLIASTLINAMAAALATVMAIHFFGHDDSAWCSARSPRSRS